MRMHLLSVLLAALCLCSAAWAAPITNVVQYPTGFFVPDEDSTYNAPYYRWFDQDWGWTHNAIGQSFTAAELYIMRGTWTGRTARST